MNTFSVTTLELLNLFDYLHPGIYEIICQVNEKHYIGEAVNVLDRLGKHSRSLLENTHECTALQKDWNLYGSHQFKAKVLFYGPSWASKTKRLEKEMDIIRSYPIIQVYNTYPGQTDVNHGKYRLSCEIHGICYSSLREASIQLGESQNRIRAKLKNQVPGYVLIGRIPYGYSPVCIEGRRHYDSIQQAVEAGEAANRLVIARRLKSKKYPDWNYLDPEKTNGCRIDLRS